MAAALKPASLLDVAKTVLAGGIGIRRKADHQRALVKPAHIVAAGLVFAALFVLTLVTIVKVVISQSQG